MIAPRLFSIFRRGSRTYFYASLFFPPEVRADVFALYAFVRVADDLVDCVPQDVEGFGALVERHRVASAGASSDDPVVDGFAALARRRGFDPAWVEAFLGAMSRDITQSRYLTMQDLQAYMYGSAEVVGLMMARILGLPEASHPYARQMGAAMQYVNFLRDVAHDRSLGRTYIPAETLDRHNLADLRPETVLAQQDDFRALMRCEVERYLAWQAGAEAGYRYIPSRYRIPVQTAADMYAWTARRIAEDPLVVLRRTVKPSRPRIVWRLATNGASVVGPALARRAERSA